MLICPVRGCGLDLLREVQRLRCARRHSFDVARSGYINLLQPQDRRSSQPGDTAEAVAARRGLHERGATAHLLAVIKEMLNPAAQDIVLDAGCGDGFYLGSLAQQTGLSAHGLDISTPAIDAAARRYPDCEWIIANADRFVPYADRTFSAVMSITARMNSLEFRRVLRDDGRLLVALSAPDDLVELCGMRRDRVARTIDTFNTHFKLHNQQRVSRTIDLDVDSVRDVLISVYRPLQSRTLQATRVTFSFDLLLFRPT